MRPASFDPIVALEAVMRGFPRPWFISGGWAIDLFVGRVTREHEDVEVGAFFPDQDALRHHLADWQLFRIREDRWEPWESGDTIALPEFQAQARTDGQPLAMFDIFLNPLEGDDWVSRRHPGLRRQAGRVARRTTGGRSVPSGVPHLVPEIQLLCKAKYHRPKDDADFAATVGLLGARRRAWLKRALEVHHPGDPWLERL